MTDDYVRTLARSQHQVTGDVEIDDDAKISRTDNGEGAWVTAWVYVDLRTLGDPQ